MNTPDIYTATVETSKPDNSVNITNRNGKPETDASGVSYQTSKAGYIQVNKSFTGKKPRTTCCITEAGKAAMEEYVEALKSYLNL